MPKLKELPPFVPSADGGLQKLRERAHRLATTDAPRYAGKEPVDAVSLYNELLEDYETAHEKYYEKRLRLCGIVSKIEKDEFGAPSFQFTDEGKTRCYALIVFPTAEIYEKVREGDRAEIIGNVVFIREPYGLVVKKSELLEVAK